MIAAHSVSSHVMPGTMQSTLCRDCRYRFTFQFVQVGELCAFCLFFLFFSYHKQKWNLTCTPFFTAITHPPRKLQPHYLSQGPVQCLKTHSSSTDFESADQTCALPLMFIVRENAYYHPIIRKSRVRDPVCGVTACLRHTYMIPTYLV